MMTTFDKLMYMDIRDGNIVNTEEKRLTLAYEGITEVPSNLVKDYGDVVEILDLSYNKLSNVDFLASFTKITTLILDHNYLTAETVFPPNPSLTTLWLNHNFIDKLHPFVHKLGKSFKNLKFLSLMGNTGAPSYLNGGTYYEFIQYRLFVIAWIPQLEYLDDRVITDDQRAEAKRLFGRSLYSTLVEEQIPELIEKFMARFRGSFSQQVSPAYRGEHECSVISSNPSGNETNSNHMASIPVTSHPVRLNSSDSESSLNLPKRKPRNLVI